MVTAAAGGAATVTRIEIHISQFQRGERDAAYTAQAMLAAALQELDRTANWDLGPRWRHTCGICRWTEHRRPPDSRRRDGNGLLWCRLDDGPGASGERRGVGALRLAVGERVAQRARGAPAIRCRLGLRRSRRCGWEQRRGFERQASRSRRGNVAAGAAQGLRVARRAGSFGSLDGHSAPGPPDPLLAGGEMSSATTRGLVGVSTPADTIPGLPQGLAPEPAVGQVC